MKYYIVNGVEWHCFAQYAIKWIKQFLVCTYRPHRLSSTNNSIFESFWSRLSVLKYLILNSLMLNSMINSRIFKVHAEFLCAKCIELNTYLDTHLPAPSLRSFPDQCNSYTRIHRMTTTTLSMKPIGQHVRYGFLCPPASTALPCPRWSARGLGATGQVLSSEHTRLQRSPASFYWFTLIVQSFPM